MPYHVAEMRYRDIQECGFFPLDLIEMYFFWVQLSMTDKRGFIVDFVTS